MKVLVVEDDFPSRELLRIFIEKEGHECITAEDGKLGFDIFKKNMPDIIISDVRMPQMNGVELLETVRKISKDVLIVFVTGHGNEDLALKALELGANNYLKKPIDLSELKVLLKRYETLIQNKNIEHYIPDFIISREFELVVDSDLNLIQSVANYLVDKTGVMFDTKERIRIELGLTELLLNSVEHGNWEISSEEKTQALLDNTLMELYNTKTSNAELKERRVKIIHKQTDRYCEWLIQDEGCGFNWKCTPNSSNQQFMKNNHGRGIFLSKLQFDEFEYIGIGNTVRVKKYFKQ